MKPPPTLDHSLPTAAAHTVHLATRITDEVFSFIGPATEALVGSGAEQTVVFLDDPTTHAAIERFDHRVRLQRVPNEGSWPRRLHRLRAALSSIIQSTPGPLVIHLHGVLPLLCATRIAGQVPHAPLVYFSPHSSRLLGRFKPVGDVALWLAGRMDAHVNGHAGRATIASLRADTLGLAGPQADAVTLIESPISRRFAEAPRWEAQRPLIVGGTQSCADDGMVDMFTRFAVLLADSAAAPEFVWFGETSDEQRQRLSAAGVRQIAWYDENTRAEVLSRAWIYLAPPGGRGVPLGLMEAMACSVACVAAETPFHTDVVTHLRNGLIYRDESQALSMIAQLIDQPESRLAIGRNARREALKRFDIERFNQRLLRAYGHAAETRQAPAGTSTVNPSPA